MASACNRRSTSSAFFTSERKTNASPRSRATLCSQIVNNFFAQRAWQLLVPDWPNAFLTNGGSYTNANFASAAQASDGRWGAIYVPKNESLTVAMSGFNAPKGALLATAN